ncbi:hypothetical protein FOMPIDRAFT_1080114, partial [Fomitopsis schrenkii]
CRFCGAQASLRCSQCKTTFYCCKEHSTSDWKRHKRLCVPAEGVQARPFTIDAILFPVDGDRPRMIKIPCDVQVDDNDEDPIGEPVMHHLNLRQRDKFMHVRPMNLGGGAVTCLPAPGYNLDVWYDDCYAINGSLPTRCVEVLTGGKAPERWAGNVIAVRTERPLAYCIRYYNANMQEDLPRLLDFFGRY